MHINIMANKHNCKSEAHYTSSVKCAHNVAVKCPFFRAAENLQSVKVELEGDAEGAGGVGAGLPVWFDFNFNEIYANIDIFI